MNKKDNIKLSAISQIDEKYVDESTKTRIRLLAKPKKKKKGKYIAAIVAFAATLTIITSLILVAMIPLLMFLIPWGGEKQVPVYTGMTVSGEAKLEEVLESPEDYVALLKNEDGIRVVPLSGRVLSAAGGIGGAIDHKKPFEEGKNNIIDRANSILSVVGVGEEIYYAKANEDIYITVHVDNPDDFEILSFTLNQKTYASYMFEDGSDMENLILKYNVGEAYGIIEYTLDEIKYVDGVKIKDVILQGDRTVRVGVYTPNQPMASVKNLNAGLEGVSFDITLTDAKGILGMSGGKVEAFVYDGDNVVAQKEVLVGETTKIELEGLKHNTLYQLSIIAKYDAFDGQGVTSYALYQEAFYTPLALEIGEVQVTQTGVSFNYLWDSGASAGKIEHIRLYKGDEKVRDIDTDVSDIDGLLSNTSYRLVFDYSFGGTTDTLEYNFTTKAKTEPIYAIKDITSTDTGIRFGITETDVDGIGEITKIELVHGTAPILSAPVGNEAVFEDLLSDNNYIARITYTYDLNDGMGVQTKTVSKDIRTKAKIAPVYTIDNVTKSHSEISFDIGETDAYGIGSVVKVELLKDGDAPIIGVTGNSVTFTGLSPATVYTVKITYEYDLGDGRGVRADSITRNVITRARDIAVTDISINSGSEKVEVGGTAVLVVTVNNPDGVDITYLKINGTEVPASEFISGTKYIVEYVPSSLGGNETLGCTEITYRIQNEEFVQATEYTDADSITIIGDITVQSLSTQGNKFIFEDREDVEVFVTFTGSEAYDVKSIELKGMFNPNNTTTYPLKKVSDTVYSFTFKGKDANKYSGYEYTYHKLSVKSITYGANDLVLTREISSEMEDLTLIWEIPMTNVIEISTVEQLKAVSGDRHYRLVNDIDLTGVDWTPIEDFSGIFDGNGYSIKNLRKEYVIPKTAGYGGGNFGLFGTCEGIVKNLNIENGEIQVHNMSEYTEEIGFIAGKTYYALIYNCNVEGSITYTNADGNLSKGGISSIVGCGDMYSAVLYCTFVGELNYSVSSEFDSSGGPIIGWGNTSGDITVGNCTAYVNDVKGAIWNGKDHYNGCKLYPLSQAPDKD